MRYRAFISYSHNDARWASWLHRGLEGYRVPSRLRGSSGEFGPLPDRLSPIFKDREDLASAGELGPKIQAALADSEALIVICSPDAARSQWVNGEILRFKRTGRADRIYCLIVAGEPNTGDERECFAPALRFDLDAEGNLGTQPAEPIAADVRPGKDGKALARLKLLSGLLGVPLDTLRQREATRQKRRLLAITALAVLVMLVTSYLAVQAVIARNAAERRQKQAEALVDFMLGDLTNKLSEVSRLDILESVDNQAMAYFQSLPTTDVTDEALQQRAKTFVKIGHVRSDQGRLPEALQSFQAAADIAAKLVLAKPDDVDRQLAYSDILTSIGTVHWYQGELDQAQAGFEAARKLVLRVATLAPTSSDVLSQLIIFDNNIGHVLEARGRLDAAILQYRNMLVACNKLVAARPDDVDAKVKLGLAHNNLAKMALLKGDLAGALDQYRADVAIEYELATRDPQNNDQAEKLLISRATYGRTLALTGEVDAGVEQLQQAVTDANRLIGIEPTSTSFLEDAGLYGMQLAHWLRVNGDADAAKSSLEGAVARLDKIVRQEPRNIGWQRELAEAGIERAEQLRASGDAHGARGRVLQALKILEPQLEQRPNDSATVLATSQGRLLMAELTVEPDQARELREQVLSTLQAQTSAASDPRLQSLLVETLLTLDQRKHAMALLPVLWKTGYRDPAFVALLSREHVVLELPANDAVTHP